MIPIEFFDSLFPEREGYLAVSYMKGPRDDKQVSNKFFELSDRASLYAETADRVSRGWDAYFVPAIMKSAGRTKEDFSHSHVAWVDLDGTNPPPVGELAPSYVVQSSPGKYHLYWLLTEPVERQTLEAINQSLAKALSGDRTGWDCTQLLRIPGTLNYKYTSPEPVAIRHQRDVSFAPSFFPLILGSMRFMSQRL